MATQVRVDPEDGTVAADRSVRPSGRSLVVTLPPQVLEAAGIKEGDDVEIITKLDSSGNISIEKAGDSDADDKK
jgi:antitoxin component of MazEF toxin-antitoxin module